MISKIRKNRALTAFFASALLAIFYLTQITLNWPGLRLSGIAGTSKFIDGQFVTTFAKCFQIKGLRIYDGQLSEATCTGFPYSIELLRILNITRFVNLGTERIGYIFIITSIMSISYYIYQIKNTPRSDIAIAIVAFSSPGIWLLLERGNYDAIILALVTLSMYSLRYKSHLITNLLLGLATIFKFFTLPVLLLNILSIPKRSKRILFLGIFAPVLTYAIYLIRKVTAFPESWNVSFGLKSTGLYLQLIAENLFNSSTSIKPELFALPGVILLVCFIFVLHKNMVEPGLLKLHTDNYVQKTYDLILAIFISCYLVGMNYDYRLIYVAILTTLSRVIFANNRFNTILLISGLTSLYFSCFTYGLTGKTALVVQLVGDLSLSMFTAIQLTYIWSRYSYLVKSRVS